MSGKKVEPVDVIVKLLKTTDGRDKLYKWAASMAKVLSDTQSNPEMAKRMGSLAKSIGDARSVCQFFLFCKTLPLTVKSF